MSTERMSGTERNALMKLVARRARVAASDLEAMAAERYAEWERQATAEWDARDLGVAELVAELNAELAPRLAELNERVTEWCDENNIVEAFRPNVSGGVGLGYSHAHRDRERRADLRREAKSLIDAAKKRAKVEVERERTKIETAILSSAIESAEAAEMLASLPTADALLPPVTIAEVEAAKAGGRQ